MDIRSLISIMKRVHDEEGWNLGTASTRDQRNYFLERVCGIVHWGHQKYNPTPDPQWHCKDPDGPNGGRPPSDDVVVSMPSRTMFDCIPNCGADGYTFANNPHGEHLADQFIFVPSRPKLVDGPDVPHPRPIRGRTRRRAFRHTRAMLRSTRSRRCCLPTTRARAKCSTKAWASGSAARSTTGPSATSGASRIQRGNIARNGVRLLASRCSRWQLVRRSR